MADTHETKLKEYIPEFIYQIRDIALSSGATDTQIKKLWEAELKRFGNAFITTADEDGIKVFEKTLEITPEPGETLEERKTNALMMWNYSIPFTDNYLLDYLENVYGREGYTYTKNAPKSEVLITVDSVDEALNNRVKKVIRRMIPAHELLNFIASIMRELKLVINASVMTFTEEEIMPDICEGYSIERNFDTNGYAGTLNFNLQESEVN